MRQLSLETPPYELEVYRDQIVQKIIDLRDEARDLEYEPVLERIPELSERVQFIDNRLELGHLEATLEFLESMMLHNIQ